MSKLYSIECKKLDEYRKLYKKSIDNLSANHKKQLLLTQSPSSMSPGENLCDLKTEEFKLRNDFRQAKRNMEKQRTLVLEIRGKELKCFYEKLKNEYKGKYVKILEKINKNVTVTTYGLISNVGHYDSIVYSNVTLTDVIQFSRTTDGFSINRLKDTSIFILKLWEYSVEGNIEFEKNIIERQRLQTLIDKYKK